MNDQATELLIEIRQTLETSAVVANSKGVTDDERVHRLEGRLKRMSDELKSINWMLNICAFAALVWLAQTAYHLYKG